MGLFHSTLHDFSSPKEKQFHSLLSSFVPLLNIQESKEAYHLEVELPGVKKDEVEITIKGDDLVIRGEKMCVNPERKNQYHRIERAEGAFYRAVNLPKDIDKEKINADLKDGVLGINIMKSNNIQLAEIKITIR
jgi:HSP20 family protein